MKKSILRINIGHLQVRAFTFVCAMLVALSPMFGLVFVTDNAGAAQTSEAYCSQYTSSGNLNACKDGILGKDCSDYAVTYDQAAADICMQAQLSKSTGQISDTPTFNPADGETDSTEAQAYKNVISSACAPYSSDKVAEQWCLNGGMGENGTEGTPKTPQSCISDQRLQGSTTNQGACITGATAGQAYNSAKTGTADNFDIGSLGGGGGGGGNSADSPGAIQDLLDQAGGLSETIDKLHALGPDAGVDTTQEADNNYGSYVNGAGKQQKINVHPCMASFGGSCPAIIAINGGAWHSNDGVSDMLAKGSAEKNAGGGYIGPPAGGGANARGYTVLEVTYRLGSSGIYYMFEDVMRGIQHVRNNASMYGIDAGKIAVMGDSAGGSLAVRAAASGKTGAKAMVGWSAPTNGYTALFKSYKTFMLGLDHSTCVPTDLAGAANTSDLLAGGSGDVASHQGGLSNNDFSGLASGDAIDTITQVLTAGQYAAATSQNVESITQQLMSGDLAGLGGGVINLAASKIGECLDNFNVMSPALFASPDSPAGFFGGFDSDDVIDPQQLYDMRDKLLSLGRHAEALVLQGDASAPAVPLGATANHLGYDPRFVCPTLNFLDKVMGVGQGVNCETGESLGGPNINMPDIASALSGGGGGGNSSGGGSGGGGGGGTSSGGGGGGTQNSNSNTQSQNGSDQRFGSADAAERWTCSQGGSSCSTQPSAPTPVQPSGPTKTVCAWPTAEENLLCSMGINPL